MIPATPRRRIQSRSYVVIPARTASTRLPRKLLLRETGKSLLEHTYQAAHRAEKPQGVCVAAADRAIAEDVARFGGEVHMTPADCPSGTDRVADVARRLDDVDIVVNVQGDEPELPAEAIDLVIRLLEENPSAAMATLATPLRSRQQLDDPACVKVVFDRHGRALYFSRSPIPHAREFREELLQASPAHFFQHIGLYAYRREFLLELAATDRTPLETLENLEQLRVIETGSTILVGQIDQAHGGIDTPEDYQAFVARMRRG